MSDATCSTPACTRASRTLPSRSRSLYAIASVLAIVVTLAPGIGAAQDRRSTLAGFQYDPSLPTLKQVVGHDHGEEVTTPEEMTVYLRALALAAPTRTRLVEYGRTWEGRPLLLLAIATPARIASLDAIKQDLRRLADPRGLSSSEIDDLVDRTPIVVALLHSVHGNEISPGGAALLEAYHLLAARNDPRVDTILEHAIVLIDPLQNPDGRARMAQGDAQRTSRGAGCLRAGGRAR